MLSVHLGCRRRFARLRLYQGPVRREAKAHPSQSPRPLPDRRRFQALAGRSAGFGSAKWCRRICRHLRHRSRANPQRSRRSRMLPQATATKCPVIGPWRPLPAPDHMVAIEHKIYVQCNVKLHRLANIVCRQSHDHWSQLSRLDRHQIHRRFKTVSSAVACLTWGFSFSIGRGIPMAVEDATRLLPDARRYRPQGPSHRERTAASSGHNDRRWN